MVSTTASTAIRGNNRHCEQHTRMCDHCPVRHCNHSGATVTGDNSIISAAGQSTAATETQEWNLTVVGTNDNRAVVAKRTNNTSVPERGNIY